jgi:hypothetical protein
MHFSQMLHSSLKYDWFKFLNYVWNYLLLCSNMFSFKQSMNNFKQMISVPQIICQDLIWYLINIKFNIYDIENFTRNLESYIFSIIKILV